jgi:hypothetical protein
VKKLFERGLKVPIRLFKNQTGISILAVIFVIVVLTAIGYTFSAMMASKQKSVPVTLEGSKAFYIAEGGVHFAGEYLEGLADWSTAANQTRNLGGGSFTVVFSGYSYGIPETITATSTGTNGSATRELQATFQRTPLPNTVRDEFNARAYNGNDGSDNWSTDWLEINESNGPSAGDEQVLTDGSRSYVLRVRDNDGGGEGVQREVDLSGYTSATLSLEYRRVGLDGSSDYVTVEVSDNGGSSWTEISRFEGPTNDSTYQSFSYDISAYIASNTRIRFLSSSTLGGQDRVYFDNVEISYN